ncbi:MAG: NnrU family protein [Alphaproteobacteria bacterium]|nr:NnrU family protein [Alphaproteobacteria bacterium]MBU0865993.1 NnrU family protein [Alphaproteobacteria bacterium]MBU1825428.1 NnrU family protein [Alphaproteobacteria bacterium]
MQPMSLLMTTCALFVGSHLMLSHPLRHGLASRLGERGFQIVYSIVAIATFIMLVQAWRGMPPEPPLWAVGEILWILASIIVLFASVLFMGSLIGNPALAAPGAAAAAQGAPRGVFAITRHPMMWGFALWAVAHVMVVPTPAQIILSGTIVFLALVGSAGQDGKKARLMGDAWRHWAARTSFIPFARQISGATPWGDTIPRPHALFGGIVLWLVATWGHGALGYMVAGIWRWVG